MRCARNLASLCSRIVQDASCRLCAPSHPLHKRIDHLLLPRLLERHGRLVPLDDGDGPVAELLVEHPLPALERAGPGDRRRHQAGVATMPLWRCPRRRASYASLDVEFDTEGGMTRGDQLLRSVPLKDHFYDAHERRSYLRAVEVAKRIVDDPSVLQRGWKFLHRFVRNDPYQRRAMNSGPGRSNCPPRISRGGCLRIPIRGRRCEIARRCLR